MARQTQKAGVLAGAIVVERGWSEPRSGESEGGRMVKRPMHAAFERFRIKTGTCEHALDRGYVLRLAAVRGAGERELLIDETQAFRRSRLHKRQGLQRLDRRTRKNWTRDITCRK
jgi:hypothetical protein